MNQTIKNLSLISVVLFLTGSFFGCRNNNENNIINTDKQVVLRILPGPDNFRNSEGDFIDLKDGRILFVYTHYNGQNGEDHEPAYLAGRYSSDTGKTWTTTNKLILENEGRLNTMSVSLLRLKSGAIALFYLRKNSEEDCIPMMRISTDETLTWGAPVRCIPDKNGYFVLNNNRVIQLENGRLLLAVSMHKLKGDRQWNTIGRIFSYYSDNDGVTWKLGGEVDNPNKVVTQEPGVVELRNGDIFMFMRTNVGVQYEAFSKDQGLTWSPAARGRIKSPMSPASISRIPSTGDLLLAWNNNDGSIPALRDRRTPFQVAISKDEGKTWQHIKTVENDPDGWYCYTAMHFTEGHVLLGHSAGKRSGNGLAITHITRLKLNWIYR